MINKNNQASYMGVHACQVGKELILFPSSYCVHCISTCIIPCLELIRWYFWLMRPLCTTSIRLISTCPNDSCGKIMWSNCSTHEGNKFVMWCDVTFERKPKRPLLLLPSSIWIFSFNGGSSSMNWNSSFQTGSRHFFTI